MQEKILEELAEECGCFISDLKTYRLRSRVSDCLLKNAVSRYSEQELDYCLSYLLDRPVTLTSREEIIEYIKTALQTN